MVRFQTDLSDASIFAEIFLKTPDVSVEAKALVDSGANSNRAVLLNRKSDESTNVEYLFENVIGPATIPSPSHVTTAELASESPFLNMAWPRILSPLANVGAVAWYAVVGSPPGAVEITDVANTEDGTKRREEKRRDKLY